MSHPIELILAYGQSWLSRNGRNGSLKLADDPDGRLLMFDDGAGVVGTKGVQAELADASLIPAAEIRPDEQSVLLPFMLAYAQSRPKDQMIVGRSEAVPGAGLHLLSSTPGTKVTRVFAYRNLITILDRMKVLGAEQGVPVKVPYILWCQGAGSRRMPSEKYRYHLNRLFDDISALIVDRFNPETLPVFVVIQPPGLHEASRWPNLQATVDTCAERDDCILAASGWALPQRDKTHFSAIGAVQAGDFCAHAVKRYEASQGEAIPTLINFRRKGLWLEMDVQGPHKICIDTIHKTPRHMVGEGPVPFYGFDLEGANIKRVKIGPRLIRIKIDDAKAPIILSYAAHNGTKRWKAMETQKNQSGNRGNLRGSKGFISPLTGDTLYPWLASAIHHFPKVD